MPSGKVARVQHRKGVRGEPARGGEAVSRPEQQSKQEVKAASTGDGRVALERHPERGTNN